MRAELANAQRKGEFQRAGELAYGRIPELARRRLPRAHQGGEAVRARLQAARPRRLPARADRRVAQVRAEVTGLHQQLGASRPTSPCTVARRSSWCSPRTRRSARGCSRWSSAITKPRTPPHSARSCSPTWTTSSGVQHLDPEPMPRFGPGTITGHQELVRAARRGAAPRHRLGVRRVPGRRHLRCRRGPRQQRRPRSGRSRSPAPDARFAHGRARGRAGHCGPRRRGSAGSTGQVTRDDRPSACRRYRLARTPLGDRADRLLAFPHHTDRVGRTEIDMT